jgi:hypothetical protein
LAFVVNTKWTIGAIVLLWGVASLWSCGASLGSVVLLWYTCSHPCAVSNQPAHMSKGFYRHVNPLFELSFRELARHDEVGQIIASSHRQNMMITITLEDTGGCRGRQSLHLCMRKVKIVPETSCDCCHFAHNFHVDNTLSDSSPSARCNGVKPISPTSDVVNIQASQ